MRLLRELVLQFFLVQAEEQAGSEGASVFATLARSSSRVHSTEALAEAALVSEKRVRKTVFLLLEAELVQTRAATGGRQKSFLYRGDGQSYAVSVELRRCGEAWMRMKERRMRCGIWPDRNRKMIKSDINL